MNKFRDESENEKNIVPNELISLWK